MFHLSGWLAGWLVWNGSLRTSGFVTVGGNTTAERTEEVGHPPRFTLEPPQVEMQCYLRLSDLPHQKTTATLLTCNVLLASVFFLYRILSTCYMQVH